MVSSMDTSTGGLLTLVMFTNAINNNGPQISKINKTRSFYHKIYACMCVDNF